MFQLINKFCQNTKTNQKKDIPIKEKKNSNPDFQDFCDIDDFVELTLDDSFEREQKNHFNDCNKKKFLNDLSKSIFTIILDSRKNKNNNFFNIINSSESKEKYDKSFSIDIDELFLYNDFNMEKNDIQKFVIEFYLIKNENKKKPKISELVEKWKFSFKLNDNDEEMNNKSFDINYLKNKILLLKKSIISYSRILPLYQYILSNKNNEDYSIDFKFYHNHLKRKGSFSNNPSGNVLLKNSNLFSFKMNIKFYSEKEIKNIFEETEKYIDIIDKYGKKKKSLSFHKPMNPNNDFESINNNINNNNPINNNKKAYSNEIKACPTDININKNKDIDNFSESSSLVLNIYENNYEENKINNKILELSKKNKKQENNIKDKNYICCTRKCSNFSNSYETEDCTIMNSELKINDNKEEKKFFPIIQKKLTITKKNNKEINNIIKEYNLLKEMMQKMPSFSNIKTQKLITYSDIFE